MSSALAGVVQSLKHGRSGCQAVGSWQLARWPLAVGRWPHSSMEPIRMYTAGAGSVADSAPQALCVGLILPFYHALIRFA
jgi:hypothetical protein